MRPAFIQGDDMVDVPKPLRDEGPTQFADTPGSIHHLQHISLGDFAALHLGPAGLLIPTSFRLVLGVLAPAGEPIRLRLEVPFPMADPLLPPLLGVGGPPASLIGTRAGGAAMGTIVGGDRVSTTGTRSVHVRVYRSVGGSSRGDKRPGIQSGQGGRGGPLRIAQQGKGRRPAGIPMRPGRSRRSLGKATAGEMG
jgi:hypothetical protein